MPMLKIYPNGWYRITGLSKQGRKSAHYFFNDAPIHILKQFKEIPDFTKRYLNDGRKCKRCEQIINAYRFIGLENRCI